MDLTTQPTSRMEAMSVWLANPLDGVIIALATQSVREYVAEVPLLSIPASEPCCHHMAIWQEKPIPVIFTGHRFHQDVANILVLATRDNHVSEVGLAVSTAPGRLDIDDRWFTEFRPSACGIWQSVLISGFARNHESIPIIDPGKLVSSTSKFIQEANAACMRPRQNRMGVQSY